MGVNPSQYKTPLIIERKAPVNNRRLLLDDRSLLIIRNRARILRLTQFSVDLSHFRRGESAASEGCQRAQARVNLKPRPELLPRRFLLEMWEIQLGELAAAKGFLTLR